MSSCCICIYNLGSTAYLRSILIFVIIYEERKEENKPGIYKWRHRFQNQRGMCRSKLSHAKSMAQKPEPPNLTYWRCTQQKHAQCGQEPRLYHLSRLALIFLMRNSREGRKWMWQSVFVNIVDKETLRAGVGFRNMNWRVLVVAKLLDWREDGYPKKKILMSIKYWKIIK